MINTVEKTAKINKHKMAAMLHVFARQVNECKSAHGVTVMAQNIEADIDDLFSDVEFSQAQLDQQLTAFHLMVSMVINWDAPQQLRTEQIQSLKEKIKKGLI